MKLTCCCILTPLLLLSFCSNAPWSLRSKRSAPRARTLKSASGESSSVLAKSGKDDSLHQTFLRCSSSLFDRSTVKLMLRKVQYAPESHGAAPSVETTRDFVMSDKPLHVKASLDKEVGAVLKLKKLASSSRCKLAVGGVLKRCFNSCIVF